MAMERNANRQSINRWSWSAANSNGVYPLREWAKQAREATLNGRPSTPASAMCARFLGGPRRLHAVHHRALARRGLVPVMQQIHRAKGRRALPPALAGREDRSPALGA